MKKSNVNQKASDEGPMFTVEMQENLEEYMVLEKWVEVNKPTIKKRQEQLYAFETKMLILKNQINRTRKII
ncbi:MAG: hypothetical protein WD512_01435 [Candidatus Paceibacterota bacterium]